MYKIKFLINANCAVCCKNKNEAKDFFEKCYKFGITWISGDSMKSSLSEYTLNTLNFPRCFNIVNTANRIYLLSACNDYYVEKKYKIIDNSEVEI